MTICCNLACFQFMFAFFNCCAYSYLRFWVYTTFGRAMVFKLPKPALTCNLTSSTYVYGQNGILLNGHYGGGSHGQVMYLEARLDVGRCWFRVYILDNPASRGRGRNKMTVCSAIVLMIRGE